MQKEKRIHTDYSSVSKVILALPEGFYNGYDELVPFYYDLLSIIPHDITVFVICNNNQSADKIKYQFRNRNIETLVIKGWDEIWLRDCLGIINGKTIIKPEYRPNYCNQNQTAYYKKINKLSREIINECLQKEIVDIPLRFEGGNFVCNDKYAFLTDKIISDNGLKSKMILRT